MDPSQLANLLLQHKWIGATAIGIGLAVRLLKSDSKLFEMNARLRALLALGLGGASGVIDKLVEAGNTTWTTALVQGGCAALFAIMGHVLVIESMRGGKELPLPGLVKDPPQDPPFTPLGAQKTMRDPSERRDPGSFLIALFAAVVFCLTACGLTPAQEAKGVDVLENIGCIIEKAYLPNPLMNATCGLITPAQQATGNAIAAAHRSDVTKQLAAQRMTACGPQANDAGTPDANREAGK